MLDSQLNLKLLALVSGAGCLTALIVGWSTRRRSKHSNLPLPPGPKRKPIIGNLLDLPTEKQWLKIADWANEYGEIVHADALGQHLLYLNSYETTIDLLEKRSSIYSDRVITEMIKLMKAEKTLTLLPYGDVWRLNRRIFHQEFNQAASKNFKEVQLKHNNELLKLLLELPEGFESHIKHFSSGIILESVYGIQVQKQNDPYVRTVETAMTGAEALVSGAFLVDLIPALKHIPEWFPGAAFKKRTAFWAKNIADSVNLPFEEVTRQLAQENDAPSMTASWLHKIAGMENKNEANRILEALKYTAGTALFAGYETTSSTLVVFIFLMALHPEVQIKAQQELDDHVGRQRLPDFSDKENLPYINAIYQETLRWSPILPLGSPHKVMSEDEYKGMRIPKGTAVFPNVWAMTHDERVYGTDASMFRPERFLEGKLRDPSKIVFGFGRRICPGRYLAENSLFISMCSILHAFTIGKAENNEGQEIPVEEKWVSGLSVHLAPFLCSIKLRFHEAGALIKSSE